MKKMFLLAVALCFATATFAQKGKLNAAKSALKSGDYKVAYTAIEAASKHDKTKNLPDTWATKAEVLSMLSISPEIISMLGVTINESDLTDALSKAKELDTDGKYADKIAESAQVIINNSHNAGAIAFTDAKDYETAVKSFEQKIKLREMYMPNAAVDTVDYLILGASQLELGNKAEGVKNYEKLIELGYDDPAVYNTVINYYRDVEDNDAYLATLQAAQIKYPDNNNYKLLEIDYRAANGEDVLTDMVATAKKEPNNVNLLVMIADRYKKKDNIAQERVWLQKALAVEPENMSANFNLGVSYFNEAVKNNDIMNFEATTTSAAYVNAQKQRDALATKAFPYFEKSYELAPNEPAVLAALVQYYRMKGQKDLQAKYQAELDAAEGN